MMLNLFHFVVKGILHLLYRVRVIGRDRLPEGATVICGNHTALFDPLFIMLYCKIGELPYTLAKKELFQSKFGNWFFRFVHGIPVDRDSADLRAIKMSLDVLRKGKRVLIFPEGTRVSDPDAADHKSGISMLALKTDAWVLPVYITAGKKTLFKKITVIFGEPYKIELHGQKPNAEIYAREAEAAMSRVFALRDQYHV